MKFSIAILYSCWLIILVSAGNNGTVSIPIEPTASTQTTTSIPITTTNPSTDTTTSTTTKPTTITTTTSSSTPSSTETTTSRPTISTTAIPSTTTPKPTPAPAPKKGQWIVNGTVNGTTEACIIVNMAAQFSVTYINTDNKTVSELITLPSKENATKTTGVCGTNEQVITIWWVAQGNSNNSLTLHFVKNETKYYSLHHVELYLTPENLPKVNSNATIMLIHNSNEYRTTNGNSYRCAKLQRLSLNAALPNTTGYLSVSDLQFQAFRTEKNTAFGYAEDCALETQDIVPIAVGCALIALIVIVLVAYLVGRRRSQARGYFSM